MSILEVTDLSVRYGLVTAVDSVSFTVEPGTLTGVIGPNGAGKSSLLDALSGFVPYSGHVALEGRSLDGMPPHARALAGISRTFQATVFSQLSVAENVHISTERPTLRGMLRDAVRPRIVGDSASVSRALELVGLADLADRRPSELSNGQRRLVGVARALAMNSHVVVLDEPAAGLDDSESEILQLHLMTVVSEGVAVLLVEHDMRLVFAVCDPVLVLVGGRLIANGTPKQVRSNEPVVDAYLGRPASGAGNRSASQ